MKNPCCLISLVAALVLTGCGKESPAPPSTPQAAAPAPAAPPPAPVVRAAPAPAPAASPNSYMGGLARAQQLAVKTVDLSSLNENIQLFNTQEGRYPKDLNELVTMRYIGKLPVAPNGMKLVYDATQGKVTAVPQ
jgi:hypothetical protein